MDAFLLSIYLHIDCPHLSKHFLLQNKAPDAPENSSLHKEHISIGIEHTS